MFLQFLCCFTSKFSQYLNDKPMAIALHSLCLLTEERRCRTDDVCLSLKMRNWMTGSTSTVQNNRIALLKWLHCSRNTLLLHLLFYLRFRSSAAVLIETCQQARVAKRRNGNHVKTLHEFHPRLREPNGGSNVCLGKVVKRISRSCTQ